MYKPLLFSPNIRESRTFVNFCRAQLALLTLTPRNSPRVNAVSRSISLVVVAFDSGFIVNKRTDLGHLILVLELVGSGFRFAPVCE